MSKPTLQALARKVIEIEAQAIQRLSERIDANFDLACELLLAAKGRIIVMGMGKSGHIGRKMAATLASTGSPAFYVHPGEASHGDLGMVLDRDVVILLSNSGETEEILLLLPLLKRMDTHIIALTGNPSSTIAQQSDINLDTSVDKEACPLDLAPTASIATSLAMGDAIAVALLEARGFDANDFARTHPGGKLGKSLLIRVKDAMYSDDEIPHVPTDANLKQGLLEMSQKGLGMTLIVDAEKKVRGIFTDGDLRRALDNSLDIHNTSISDIMNAHCYAFKADQLAAEALEQMKKQRINSAPVTNEEDQLIGAITMHSLLKTGVA